MQSDGEPYRGYKQLVAESEVDSIVGQGATWTPATLKHGRRRRVPTLMALATSDKETLKTLELVNIGDDNPWHLSYLAIL